MNKSLRQRVLSVLRQQHGVDEDFIAERVAQVIKGETVKKKFRVDESGNERLTSIEVTAKAEDVARGLVFMDHLHNGKLGFGSRSLDLRGDTRKMIEKHAPKIDERIIWNKSNVASEAEVVDIEPEDE